MSFSSKGKHHARTIDRIRIACRYMMLNLGMRDGEIAAAIGMSATSFSLLKKTKIWAVIYNQYLTGVLSEADADIADNFQLQRKILSRGVPTALENLLHLAQQKLDRKLQFEASKEILDRHGIHAKVSRIGLPTDAQTGAANPRDNEIAAELIAAQTRAKQRDADEVTIDSPPASETTQ